jgi:hypothetical protein
MVLLDISATGERTVEQQSGDQMNDLGIGEATARLSGRCCYRWKIFPPVSPSPIGIRTDFRIDLAQYLKAHPVLEACRSVPRRGHHYRGRYLPGRLFCLRRRKPRS